MTETVLRNAIITSAEIFWDGSGPKLEVKLNYGNAEGFQSAGVHALTPELVNQLMLVARVDRWSQLPGQVVRARAHRTEGVEALAHVTDPVWLQLSHLSTPLTGSSPPSDEDIPF